MDTPCLYRVSIQDSNTSKAMFYIEEFNNKLTEIKITKLMRWYLKVLRQYADFSGRARRKEYWMFVLFNLIFSSIARFIDNVLGLTIEPLGYGYMYMLYVLIMIIPVLAVTVRRLHDVGKSGWMYFIILIPIIGLIWFLVLMATDSSPGENQYGKNPKE